MLKVLEVALAEEGYLEKKSASQLDSKTGNAGSGNYTKYARDLYPSLQGQPWCDVFVDWCMVQAYGKEKAEKLLCGGFSAYTPTSATYYTKANRWSNTPKAGAQIFFKNALRICHTGLVYKVDTSKVYTIEGNTSGASGVIANGGGVCRKSYPISYAKIAGYGLPDYPDEQTDSKSASSKSDAIIQGFQRQLYSVYRQKIAIDGEYGPETKTAVIRAIQGELNKTTVPALQVDGVAGAKTLAALDKDPLKKGGQGSLTYLLQGLLYCLGYDPGTLDADFGAKTDAAVRAFQRTKALDVDGVVGRKTWTKMLAE